MLLLFNQQPYHHALLRTAERLLAQGEPTIAVITAHIACEVYAEQILAFAFKKRGVADVAEAVSELLPSNNLANERVRKLYTALTGDEIQNTAFWSRFKESATLRNKAVHSRKRASAEQAQETCETAHELVKHLATIARAL